MEWLDFSTGSLAADPRYCRLQRKQRTCRRLKIPKKRKASSVKSPAFSRTINRQRHRLNRPTPCRIRPTELFRSYQSRVSSSWLTLTSEGARPYVCAPCKHRAGILTFDHRQNSQPLNSSRDPRREANSRPVAKNATRTGQPKRVERRFPTDAPKQITSFLS